MKLYTLMENTAASPEFISSHGLSFYIETGAHRILFDMGPDGRFLENAEKLGVDIQGVDLAVLSHGHYDHGGGLPAFLEANHTAKVHVQSAAFGDYFAHDPDGRQRYIGIPKELAGNPRIICHDGDYLLDEGLQMFAGVTGEVCSSPANDRLFMGKEGAHIPDTFGHEQNLLIEEDGKTILIAGCAHSGMVNILNAAETYALRGIDVCIGGMHLKGAYEEPEQQERFCREMAAALGEKRSRFFTCHCTTVEAYRLLHREMGERIRYLSAGSVLEI